MNRKSVTLGLLALAGQLMVGSASAAPVTWTDWIRIASTAAFGDMGGVSVNVVSVGAMNGPSQVECGINYWTQPDPSNPAYTGGTVSNAPTACEQVALSNPVEVTVTFSAPVTNLYMALLSVGQPNYTVTYDFDTAFTIDSEGRGYWGDGSYSLGGGDSMAMQEFHGVLLFAGPVTSISFTTAPAEYWHAFTFGYAAATVPEPATLALLGTALLGFGIARRRRR